MVTHRGSGFRENCELIAAYARVMHFLTIEDQLPRLEEPKPGGVRPIGFAEVQDPPPHISSSDDGNMSEQRT